MFLTHFCKLLDLLLDPFGAQIDLDAFTEKLMVLAGIKFLEMDGGLAGMVILYAKDMVVRAAHIPIVAIRS